MSESTRKSGSLTIGIDVGDRWSHLHVVDGEGRVVEEARIATTPEAYRRRFAGEPRARIALEVGMHSPWIHRLLVGLGHEVLVANARKLSAISDGDSKSDRVDAELLARLARVDPLLLSAIEHRPAELSADRAVLKSRHALVRARASLINSVRGMVKPFGAQLPKTSAEAFSGKAGPKIPLELRPALLPVLDMIAALTAKIRSYDKKIEELIDERHEVARHLQQVPGVGPITSLAYVLTIADPRRFRKSRAVGAYLGLRPRRDQSGGTDRELRITKSGDGFLRQMLVQSAHYILGAFGKDTDLRRWGLKIAARGKKRAKKVAIAAVARKLAVLLHRLWITGEVYEPLRPANAAAA